VADAPRTSPASDERSLRAEIARLSKVVKALMDRAERSTSTHGSDFSRFQTSIMLEHQVRQRTRDLEASFRENERITRALRESESRFRGLVNQSLAGIAIIEDGRCAYANPKLAEMFGYTVEEALHVASRDIAAESESQRIDEQLQRRLRGEMEGAAYRFQGLRKDGSPIDIEAYSSVMEMDGKPVLISMMVDITERVRAEREVLALQDQLREQAIRDPMTGLYNRLPLNEFFDRELRMAERHRSPISVVMGDLDHFKVINDTYGHQAGDAALKVFGDLIRQSHRASDIPCRYGGEEFLILLPDMTLERACKRTEHLRATLAAAPVACGELQFHVTASFGVATFPRHGRTREALIAAAELALYAAKNNGRNQVRDYTALIGLKR
jgi:diguanylate cyclase (GGDEF)-like protein/PAS domain S-box-containing protein